MASDHSAQTTVTPVGDEKITPRISDRERKVLLAYAEYYPDSTPYMRTIAEDTKLDASAVKRAVRSLARKGLTELCRGLFDDDGYVAGSGYSLTSLGWQIAQPFIAKQLDDLNASIGYPNVGSAA